MLLHLVCWHRSRCRDASTSSEVGDITARQIHPIALALHLSFRDVDYIGGINILDSLAKGFPRFIPKTVVNPTEKVPVTDLVPVIHIRVPCKDENQCFSMGLRR